MANSYVESFYFSEISTITLSIDKINISIYTIGTIHHNHKDNITNALIDYGFKVKSDYLLRKRKGDVFKKRIRMFTGVDNTAISLIYDADNRVPSNIYPVHKLILYRPTREFVDWIDSVLNAFGFNTKVSKIELTFDFRTDDIYGLRRFLKNHMFLRYFRSKPWRYKSTHYLGSPRTDTKGTRDYPKEVGGERVLRLELVLNRSVIRRLGLEMPLENIDSVDLKKFIRFKTLNEGRLRRYLIGKNQQRIRGAEERGSIDGELIVRMIESYIGACGDIMMDKVNWLKSKEHGVLSYSRFFEEMEDFTEHFFGLIRGQSWLPRRGG